MFILGRLSTVALHLLLITHIAHTFVLLTANVEDVKKLARKFVSDELADKIAEFIARATETFTQTAKTSEENLKDNTEVSAENRMYNNIQRHGFDNPNDYDENFREDSDEKDELQSTDITIPEAEDTETTSKPKKQIKSRSRYIVEPDSRDTTTEKPAKYSEEEKYSQMRESIKLIEHNLVAATKKINNKKETKNTVKPYKLLYNFESDEKSETDVKDESFSQEKKKIKLRAFDDKMVKTRNDAVENGYQSKKSVKVPMLARNEPENNYKNENAQINEKAAKTGSLVKENDDNARWWEKDLPRHNQDDAQLKRKSWF